MERYALRELKDMEDYSRREAEREKVLQERIQSVVGEERIADLQRQTFERQWEEGRDRFRSELDSMAEGLNIDSATMERMLDQLKPVLVEIGMKSSGPLTAEERQQTDREAKALVDQRILEVLGPAGPPFIERWNAKLEPKR
jgi:hypothetical protein